MTLEELRAIFRRQVHDEARPYLWSDDEIAEYLNEAQHRACERARLIFDESTPAVCNIPVLPGIAVYPLHPAILEIVEVSVGVIRALKQTTRGDLDFDNPAWRGDRGVVERYIDDVSTMRLYRIPIDVDLLTLSVFRGPLNTMAEDGDTPEIPARWHARLVDGALRQAFEKQDSELYNPALATFYENAFTASFGSGVDANVQRKQRQKRPPLVKAAW